MKEFAHFLRLVQAGKNPAASSGQRQALALARAAIASIPGLDGQAREGFVSFVELVAAMPESARRVVEGER